MLKRTISYEDYNGEKVDEVFYFNLSKPELIELEVEFKGGLSGAITSLTEANDNQGLLRLFKRIILLSYGQKAEDGKRFVKSDEIREAFTQSPAYEVLFVELSTNEDAVVEFLKGVLPKDMQDQIAKAEAERSAPPLPPSV